MGTEIYTSKRTIEAVQGEVGSRMNDQKRLALINVAGLTALVAFTGLVYVRTQEPLILIVGGLVSVVAVIGAMMGQS
jgi:1,4-dihydroxy-2-naphthoate octaprenyltransferase